MSDWMIGAGKRTRGFNCQSWRLLMSFRENTTSKDHILSDRYLWFFHITIFDWGNHNLMQLITLRLPRIDVEGGRGKGYNQGFRPWIAGTSWTIRYELQCTLRCILTRVILSAGWKWRDYRLFWLPHDGCCCAIRRFGFRIVHLIPRIHCNWHAGNYHRHWINLRPK